MGRDDEVDRIGRIEAEVRVVVLGIAADPAAIGSHRGDDQRLERGFGVVEGVHAGEHGKAAGAK